MMEMLEAQMKADQEKFDCLDFTSMTRRQKAIAENEFKSGGEKLEGKIADVLERFAILDCLVALQEFVEARAYLEVTYKRAAADTLRTKDIDDEMKRMKSAQAQLRDRLAASKLDDPIMIDARDLDLTKWPYGKAEEKDKAEGEEEEK